jgi:hypothetical protein
MDANGCSVSWLKLHTVCQEMPGFEHCSTYGICEFHRRIVENFMLKKIRVFVPKRDDVTRRMLKIFMIYYLLLGLLGEK